ncbi:MAG: aldehyde ferredoxin oxidoreductase, partial [Thermoprotei archaeon]
MEWKGYVGRLLYVDLSEEKLSDRELAEEEVEMYIGGIGLAAKIVCEEVNPRVDPFAPENVLVFMTGPLTGTLVPTSGRYVVAAKSPLTLAWGEAHASGFWAVELKKAGYDGIVVRGRASSPVYLYIHDGNAELRDAARLWGLTTREAESSIR